MGGVVNTLAKGVTSVSNSINNATGTRVGDLMSSGLSLADKLLNGEEKTPDAPGVDPNLEAIRAKNMQNAKDFRSNLGATKSKLTEDLSAQNNNVMNQSLHNTDENSNSRGLLYGGMNAGKKAAVRANSQANLASGVSGINTGLNDAADQLDSQAVNTGAVIQQSQQQIQNQIYSQAMAKINAQNNIGGNIVGTGLMAAMA